MEYEVIQTVCWPAQWKVESVKWPGRNNSFTEYFVNQLDACKEAQRRNELITRTS